MEIAVTSHASASVGTGATFEDRQPPDFIETGAGPLVVLVHSSLSGARQWSALMETLQDRFLVRAVNMFGYGRTPAWSRSQPPSLDDFAALVADAIPPAARKVHLVGHSMGGAVAMWAATRQLRGKVASLVLIEPSLFFLLYRCGRHKAYAEITAVLQRVSMLIAEGKPQAAAEHFVDYWSGRGAWAATPPARQAFFARTLAVVQSEAAALLRSPHGSLDWIADLPDDTLLMCSDNTTRPAREIVEVLSQARPDWALARIAEAGHMAPLTHPELVNRTIKAFITSTEELGSRAARHAFSRKA